MPRRFSCTLGKEGQVPERGDGNIIISRRDDRSDLWHYCGVGCDTKDH